MVLAGVCMKLLVS